MSISYFGYRPNSARKCFLIIIKFTLYILHMLAETTVGRYGMNGMQGFGRISLIIGTS